MVLEVERAVLLYSHLSRAFISRLYSTFKFLPL